MTVSEIKRYDLEQGPGWDAGGARVVPSDDGDYVRSDDYDVLVVEAVNSHERLTRRVQELEKALRIARGRMSHSYNCVKVNPTEEWHKDGSVTVGACICEIATVDAALAGTKEQP
jgi:hypothetical protein